MKEMDEWIIYDDKGDLLDTCMTLDVVEKIKSGHIKDTFSIKKSDANVRAGIKGSKFGRFFQSAEHPEPTSSLIYSALLGLSPFIYGILNQVFPWWMCVFFFTVVIVALIFANHISLKDQGEKEKVVLRSISPISLQDSPKSPQSLKLRDLKDGLFIVPIGTYLLLLLFAYMRF